MDKELAQLEEWAVNLINDYETELQRKDPKSTQHKRIKRFSGELVANPEAYGELLDMARSQDMTGKQLIQSIRSIESNLLDEASRGTSMSRKQLMSDVIHHFYAQRTGGDTLRKLGQADRQQARSALRELFGPWGNVPENLKSLFRAGHLKSDVLKGAEAAALNPYGVRQAKDLSSPKAHTTVGKLVTGDIPEATNWRTAFEGMARQFDRQRTEGLRAINFYKPLMAKLDEISGIVYTGLNSAEELAIRRNLLDANSSEVEKAIAEFNKPYIIEGGSTKLNANVAGLTGLLVGSGVSPALLAKAGLAAPSIAGIPLSALETKMRTEKAMETGNPLDYAQAGISGVSTAADVVPVAGEVVSTPADLLNVAIDEGREAVKDPIGYVKKGVGTAAEMMAGFTFGTPAVQSFKGAMRFVMPR